MPWLGGLFAIGLQAAAADLPPPAPPCVTNCAVALSAAQMFDLAEQLAQRGQDAAAERILEALTHDANVDIRSEARFRLGRLLERRRDWAGAARAYAAILEERPLAGPARVRLAVALAELGDDEGASRQLRVAASADLPDEVTRLVNQFQTALRSRRRLGASVELALAPDSNINSAQARSQVEVGDLPLELSDDARAQPGLGVEVSGQAFWRPRLARTTNLLTTVNLSADVYGKRQFTSVWMSATGGPEFLLSSGRLRASGVVSQRWYGGRPYASSHGVALDWLHTPDARSELQVAASVLSNSNRINPDRSGASFGVAVRYGRALSPRLFGRVTVRADRQDTRDPAFATWSAGGEILMGREFGPLTVYGRAAYSHTWADAGFSFPPARRNDELVDLEVGAVWRRLRVWGLSPVIRWRRTSNHSPVFFYDFDRTKAEVALTREF